MVIYTLKLTVSALDVAFYMLYFHNTLTIHASCFIFKGKAFVFLGDSGSGKSTMLTKALESLPKDDLELVADDHLSFRNICDGIILFAPFWDNLNLQGSFNSDNVPLYAVKSNDINIVSVIKREGIIWHSVNNSFLFLFKRTLLNSMHYKATSKIFDNLDSLLTYVRKKEETEQLTPDAFYKKLLNL